MTRGTWRLSYFTPLDFIIHSVDILTHDHSYWQWNVQERPVKSENSEVSCHIFYQRVLYRGYQCLWQIFSVPSAYIALIPRTVYLYGASTTPAHRVFPRRDFPFPEVLSFSCLWWSLAFIACFPVPLSSRHLPPVVPSSPSFPFRLPSHPVLGSTPGWNQLKTWSK